MKLSKRTWQHLFDYLLAYLLWAVSFVLGIYILYWMRELYLLGIIFQAYSGQGLTPSDIFYQAQVARAADQWSLLAVGIAAIVVIVYFEHLYRTAIPLGAVWSRFSLAIAGQLGILFIVHTAYFIIEGLIRPVLGKVVYVLSLEALVIGLFVWLWMYLQKKKVSTGLLSFV